MSNNNNNIEAFISAYTIQPPPSQLAQNSSSPVSHSPASNESSNLSSNNNNENSNNSYSKYPKFLIITTDYFNRLGIFRGRAVDCEDKDKVIFNVVKVKNELEYQEKINKRLDVNPSGKVGRATGGDIIYAEYTGDNTKYSKDFGKYKKTINCADYLDVKGTERGHAWKQKLFTIPKKPKSSRTARRNNGAVSTSSTRRNRTASTARATRRRQVPSNAASAENTTGITHTMSSRANNSIELTINNRTLKTISDKKTKDRLLKFLKNVNEYNNQHSQLLENHPDIKTLFDNLDLNFIIEKINEPVLKPESLKSKLNAIIENINSILSSASDINWIFTYIYNQNSEEEEKFYKFIAHYCYILNYLSHKYKFENEEKKFGDLTQECKDRIKELGQRRNTNLTRNNMTRHMTRHMGQQNRNRTQRRSNPTGRRTTQRFRTQQRFKPTYQQQQGTNKNHSAMNRQTNPGADQQFQQQQFLPNPSAGQYFQQYQQQNPSADQQFQQQFLPNPSADQQFQQQFLPNPSASRYLPYQQQYHTGDTHSQPQVQPQQQHLRTRQFIQRPHPNTSTSQFIPPTSSTGTGPQTTTAAFSNPSQTQQLNVDGLPLPPPLISAPMVSSHSLSEPSFNLQSHKNRLASIKSRAGLS